MIVSKTNVSEAQKLLFITIREMGDCVIVSLPFDLSLEVAGNFIHIRKPRKGELNNG